MYVNVGRAGNGNLRWYTCRKMYVRVGWYNDDNKLVKEIRVSVLKDIAA